MAAFFGPRRALRRKNCACRYVRFARAAPQAHWTSTGLSQGAPWRTRVERRLPALSSSRGTTPAHDNRWPAVGNGVMLGPISGQCFRIVDLDQPRAGRNVLAALHGNLGDASVDARCDVEPCCV